ncbi:MAG TPA: four helix bundle protein [Anaerolineales bacterium]|nr:four helix bundle protein [Anaerolineales bacterium]
MARDFKKIVAWQRADDFVLNEYKLTDKTFPPDERYGLTSQIRSAAVSVAANLAEGSGRETLQDFRRFVYQAQGSLSEVEYYLHLANRLGFIEESEYKKLASERADVGRTVQGFIYWLNDQIRIGRRS